ncbi:uncharacterized protein LOC120780822 [Bactrocera tryoni]|uniref:uncharacterized protein LOC120780822 n=1 Tax=Bactrocera tryoni TaxID=59916 RepID=UPI001A9661DA|nr:uncharacterized protein LOC120780822 [Bactrocera tryoni]
MTRVKEGKNQAPTCATLLEKVVKTLLPSQEQHTSRIIPSVVEVLSIDEEEVIEVAERFGNTKAPGLDGIPNKALKIAVKHSKAFSQDYGRNSAWFSSRSQINRREILISYSADIFSKYRKLWINLSELLQSLGNAYARTYSTYCIFIWIHLFDDTYLEECPTTSSTPVKEQLTFKRKKLNISGCYNSEANFLKQEGNNLPVDGNELSSRVDNMERKMDSFLKENRRNGPTKNRPRM